MKIQNIFLNSLLVSTILFGTSCRKYVEVEQNGTRTLKTTDDYRFLLNNKGNFETSYLFPLVTSDNIAPEVASTAASVWGGSTQLAYMWSDQFFTGEQEDVGWNNLYKQIYITNEILAGVMDSEKGTESQKLTVAAEARVHRAFAYFSLANQYAPIYDPEKVSNQPGIPMLLTPDLFQNLNRAPLSRVYDQIILDLKTAIENLPNYPDFNYHPSKIAAYALLSRVYLTMRNFEEAGKYADLALALEPTILNLEDYTKNASFPRMIDDKEVLLSKVSAGYILGPINPELISLYNEDDLRLKLFIGNDPGTYKGYKYMKPVFNSGYSNNSYVGLSSPEILLNRAEIYARQNNTAKVVELLNMLRKKRFTAAKYVAFTTADVTADLLKSVIDERRREFVGTDLRWYDMRRLTLDGNYFKPISRTFNGQSNTLTSTSPRLIYPINERVLSFNPEIGQNPR
ncbi:RagB/SusD family nutrient uptake outer membrane protein [Sphingobacterium sp. DR205]|uniref:RagB/SusD family nutrient uptake outer membrane protein n=1 Tax=Sphingobacterium sp. DR205 TaxID=2713573 RepID=UPI0013E4580E|nr:RagB/SusD family nutrient uptake outer membrane protein [Sphingobacterium sp. DR205]QIH35924.1 RagB/SusD family nutrient uptake outer membrane protein [Sphingobacterium sp. DR205]